MRSVWLLTHRETKDKARSGVITFQSHRSVKLGQAVGDLSHSIPSTKWNHQNALRLDTEPSVGVVSFTCTNRYATMYLRWRWLIALKPEHFGPCAIVIVVTWNEGLARCAAKTGGSTCFVDDHPMVPTVWIPIDLFLTQFMICNDL